MRRALGAPDSTTAKLTSENLDAIFRKHDFPQSAKF